MSVVTREWGVLGSAEDRDGAGASSSLTVGSRRREGSRVVHGPWPDGEAGDIEYEPVVRLDRKELAAALTGFDADVADRSAGAVDSIVVSRAAAVGEARPRRGELLFWDILMAFAAAIMIIGAVTAVVRLDAVADGRDGRGVVSAFWTSSDDSGVDSQGS